MYALDFEYDGINASDYGLVICSFDGTDLETVSTSSEISFNFVPVHNGNLFCLTCSTYKDNPQYTFQICKSNCYGKLESFELDEIRRIYRWLNRNDGMHKLRILKNGYENIIFEGSFNVQSIVMDSEVYGFELTFYSNRPYAVEDNVQYTINATTNDFKFGFNDSSDNIGYIYPDIEIKCNASGDLEIHNDIEDRTTIIKNCTQGEIIKIDKYMNISSSVLSHKIFDDYNFIPFRIANKFNKTKNNLTISIPCEIKIKYNPAVKGVGL